MNARVTIDTVSTSPHPRIAFVCDNPNTESAQCAQAYLRKMGLEPVPVRIPPEAEPCAAALAELQARCKNDLDGVLLMGSNGDIDPSDYGQEKLETTKEPDNRNRKPLEEKLIQWALEKDKPLLGICAGMQRLNVYLGGQLIQHVDGEWQDPEVHSYDTCTEKVTIMANTHLGRIAGKCCEEVQIPLSARSILGPYERAVSDGINSVHHQAVDPEHIGEGLRICASSHSNHHDQDIVEAIEVDPAGKFGERKSLLMGVQWHPEFLDTGLSEQLFGRFAEHAKDAKVQRERAQPKTNILAGGTAALLIEPKIQR